MSAGCEHKRLLTAAEIEAIVAKIAPNGALPDAVARAHIERVRAVVRRDLQAVSVYPSVIADLGDAIVDEYNRARIHPGESVGIVTAQSIGERQTQMTLDTFHSAGAALKTVISGVPRFSELLSASPNPKSVTARVYPSEACQDIDTLRNFVGAQLKSVRFGDLVQTWSQKQLSQDSETWYAAYDILYGTRYRQYAHYVSFQLDVAQLHASRLELAFVAARLEKYEDIVCVHSPTFIGVVDVYFDTTNIAPESVAAYAASGLVAALQKVQVCGVPGVSAVYYEKHGAEWHVETAGSDMAAFFNNPRVDYTRTYSNNIWEVLRVLGIEAVRELLIREFQDCVSSDGTCVNPCHIQLLVDTMTHGSTVMSISRYGQRKSRTSVLAKASFEESLDNFIRAGLRGETDTTKSVSASIMVGKMPTCGTGTFSLEIDIPRLVAPRPAANKYAADAEYTF